MQQPFTEKYRPRSTDEIQGHNKPVKQVLDWVQSYDTQKKKGLLLHGAPGSGKTTLAAAVAGELGLELVEVNASDVRNKASIKEQVGASMQQRSLFGQGKLILFDEMDGLSGNKDRGGIQAMTELLKTSAYPVIMTANDPWDSKFRTLRKHVQLIELKTLPYTSVLAVLKRVCDAEGILYEQSSLKQLARQAGGDLRAALTDLQTLGSDGMIDASDLEGLSSRRQAESMFNALTRILKGSDPVVAKQAADVVDENLDELFWWIDENLPREYSKPADLVRAMDALSMADVFKGRIMRWQHWRFLVYQIDFMTAGVALAKEEKYPGFTKYKRGQRGLKYWRAASTARKRDAIAGKVADVTHTSIKRSREDALPFFAAVLAVQPDHPIAAAADLDPEEAGWLRKNG